MEIKRKPKKWMTEIVKAPSQVDYELTNVMSNWREQSNALDLGQLNTRLCLTQHRYLLSQHDIQYPIPTFGQYKYIPISRFCKYGAYLHCIYNTKVYINAGDIHIQCYIQYIPRNMHPVFALLCFVVVIHWLIFPYPSGLLHWHCGNLTIAPVPAKQPWWIWINTSCEFIMKDCITTTKQSTTKPCAYFLGYTVST